MIEYAMVRYTLGLDLGKLADYTALAIVEEHAEPPAPDAPPDARPTPRRPAGKGGWPWLPPRARRPDARARRPLGPSHAAQAAARYGNAAFVHAPVWPPRRPPSIPAAGGRRGPGSGAWPLETRRCLGVTSALRGSGWGGRGGGDGTPLPPGRRAARE